MTSDIGATPTRREFLSMVGAVGGAALMYQAMTIMGVAKASPYAGPIELGDAPPGTKVVILGAGLAGMVAGMELRDAGYEVEILEFREKAGGRCWTLRSGDVYEELDGVPQTVDFAEGNYFNPGPWRIPYNHYAVLDYCSRLGVELEPFIQHNNHAYLHNTNAFDGRPMRFREINTDYRGHIAELLSKVTDQGALDELMTAEDRDLLMASLRSFGALNVENAYVSSTSVSGRRGYERAPGGGVDGAPIANEPLDLSTVLRSELWRNLAASESLNTSMPMFQPRGGMDMIAQGMAANVGDLITYNRRVTAITQDENGVTVNYEDRETGEAGTTTADYCVCTIPFSMLRNVEHNFNDALSNLIETMPYLNSIKVGLEFNRRFWEEDEHIFGGISFTNLPISMISYPSTDYFQKKPGVLLAAYSWGGTADEFMAMDPADRVATALDYGAQIHPQYHEEFKAGVAVSWARVPWTNGCYGAWSDRDTYYQDAVAVDRRVVMAGEHMSYLPAWMEGAILSSLDAIKRLHAVAVENA